MRAVSPNGLGLAGLAVLWMAAVGPAAAQVPAASSTTPGSSAGDTSPGSAPVPAAVPPPPPVTAPALSLTARFAPGQPPIRSGVKWRVFADKPSSDGTRALLAESDSAAPGFSLPPGTYIVHAAYGLAGTSKRETVSATPSSDSVVLNAGGLRLTGLLGDMAIAANRLSIAVFVPQPGNAEAKLVLQSAKAGDLIGLPEGTYHVVSTYLDTVGVGSLNAGASNATNSVVTADLRVQSGKLTDATLRHRAATLTLKLVNQAGGEALANTSFTVLTPGGDVIRELIGAFPSLVLAEGDYVVIARHDGRTFQANFAVQSALDRDIEVPTGPAR